MCSSKSFIRVKQIYLCLCCWLTKVFVKEYFGINIILNLHYSSHYCSIILQAAIVTGILQIFLKACCYIRGRLPCPEPLYPTDAAPKLNTACPITAWLPVASLISPVTTVHPLTHKQKQAEAQTGSRVSQLGKSHWGYRIDNYTDAIKEGGRWRFLQPHEWFYCPF